MLNYPTLEKLQDLRLGGMAQALQEQRQDSSVNLTLSPTI